MLQGYKEKLRVLKNVLCTHFERIKYSVNLTLNISTKHYMHTILILNKVIRLEILVCFDTTIFFKQWKQQLKLL